MQELTLPQHISIKPVSDRRAKIFLHPLHPGYGTTVGNSLRRVLLSSLPGSAVTAVKIKGVQHEFSNLPAVYEDVVDIILNLKALRLRSASAEPVKLTIEVKGEKEITGKDISKNADVTVVDPTHKIATLTNKSAEFKMEMWVENGLGYSPVESREKKKYELGTIEIDSLFSPVKTVNFEVDNIRVGQLTNYNQLTLDIETDGSMTPEEAFRSAAKILLDHFRFLHEQPFEDTDKPVAVAEEIPGENIPKVETPSEEKSSGKPSKSKKA